MKGIEAMKRHLGKPVKLELKGEDGSVDEIEISPLPLEYFPELWSVLERIIEVKGFDLENIKPEDVVKMLNKETIKTLGKLMKVSLKQSYPNADDKLLEGFIVRNYFLLLEKLFEVNLRTLESGR